MTGIKYAVSGLAIAALTAFFVLFPTAYYRQADAHHAAVTVQELTLEHAVQTLTPTETMRLLYDQGANGIYAEAISQKDGAAVAADCREIVRELFGSEDNSVIAKSLLDWMDSHDDCVVQAMQCMMLYEGQVVVLDLLSVWFDEMLFVCYEQDTLACVELSLYSEEPMSVPSESDEYTHELKFNAYISAYYRGRGLLDGEYDYFAYNSDSGRLLTVGLYGINSRDVYGMGLPLQQGYRFNGAIIEEEY